MNSSDVPDAAPRRPAMLPFETIKARAQQASGLRPIGNWDIRCIGSLIDLFPGCVPRSWRHAELACWIGEPTGEWLVSPRPGTRRINQGAPSRGDMTALNPPSA